MSATDWKYFVEIYGDERLRVVFVEVDGAMLTATQEYHVKSTSSARRIFINFYQDPETAFAVLIPKDEIPDKQGVDIESGVFTSFSIAAHFAIARILNHKD